MKIEADTNGFLATCTTCGERVRGGRLQDAKEHLAEHRSLEHPEDA